MGGRGGGGVEGLGLWGGGLCVGVGEWGCDECVQLCVALIGCQRLCARLVLRR